MKRLPLSCSTSVALSFFRSSLTLNLIREFEGKFIDESADEFTSESQPWVETRQALARILPRNDDFMSQLSFRASNLSLQSEWNQKKPKIHQVEQEAAVITPRNSFLLKFFFLLLLMETTFKNFTHF